MRAIPAGYEAHHELLVTDAMTVDFEQDEPGLGRLHAVYATYWLARHMELVSRRIILPFLEEGEEGIGFEVRVRHTASALPGMRVVVRARHLRTEGNRVHAACEAVNELGDRVGEGETTQVVLARERLERGFAELRERWGATRHPDDRTA